MKKHILLLIGIALFNLPFTASAQEPETANELNDFQKLDLFCSCINKLMNDLHPRTRVMVRDMALVGLQEAQNKLTKHLEENPDDMDRIMKDGAAMQNFDAAIEKYEGCENLNAIVNSSQNLLNPITEEEMEAYLISKVECEYAAIFFQLGNQPEEEGQKN